MRKNRTKIGNDRRVEVNPGPGRLGVRQVTRPTPGTRGSLLRVSRPAERQPDPDLGRSPGGDHIDPEGAAV